MIKLTEELYGIVVPADTEYKISGLNFFCIWDGLWWFTLEKLEGKFEILGDATADKVSFDPIKFVNAYGNDKHLDLYGYEETTLKNRVEQFYSLLQSKGLYFVNPIEKPTHYDEWISEYNKGIEHGYEKHIMLKYKEAEGKVIKGKLVIIKKM